MTAIECAPAFPESRICLRANGTVAYRHALRRGVAEALREGGSRIVVDCSSWHELDLLVLSVLMDCARTCDERGVGFELENLGGDLRARIQALRLGGRLGLRE